MNITDKEFEQLVSYMKQQAGIDLSHKRVLCETRLDNYLDRRGYHNLTEFLSAAISNGNGKEAEELINILTTNHTFFWREEKHFEYMLSHVLPKLKERYADTKDLRIWCAASSSGEEPYTLAMLNAQFFGVQHSQWDTTVLATDISTKVLKKAQDGIYSKESVMNLPKEWQKRFFDDHGDTMEVKDELKKQVIFRRLNLMDPYPFRKKLHVIFVRNVLIYFDDDTKRRIIEKMTDVLVPGGYIFVGTTESITRTVDNLEYVVPSVYRKK